MKNSHISRNRQLNIPITVKNEVGTINTVADRVAADEANATAHDRLKRKIPNGNEYPKFLNLPAI